MFHKRSEGRVTRSSSIRIVDCESIAPTNKNGGAIDFRINPITPIGCKKKFSSSKDDRYEWTFIKDSNTDFGGIVLESGLYNGENFVIEDFELNSIHAWKRMF